MQTNLMVMYHHIQGYEHGSIDLALTLTPNAMRALELDEQFVNIVV